MRARAHTHTHTHTHTCIPNMTDSPVWKKSRKEVQIGARNVSLVAPFSSSLSPSSLSPENPTNSSTLRIRAGRIDRNCVHVPVCVEVAVLHIYSYRLTRLKLPSPIRTPEAKFGSISSPSFSHVTNQLYSCLCVGVCVCVCVCVCVTLSTGAYKNQRARGGLKPPSQQAFCSKLY